MLNKLILAFALGAVLGSAGVHVNNWQYWVIAIMYVYKEKLVRAL